MEFIICHAEIQIAFVEEKKIAEVGQLAQSSFITSPSNVSSIHLKLIKFDDISSLHLLGNKKKIYRGKTSN